MDLILYSLDEETYNIALRSYTTIPFIESKSIMIISNLADLL